MAAGIDKLRAQSVQEPQGDLWGRDMRFRELSRREVLHKCFAAGLLAVASPLTESSALAFWEQQEAQRCEPTPSNELGPFFKKGAPRIAQLNAPGDVGLPLIVSGKVWDTRGQLLPEATIQVWHADHFGRYDNEGYRYRAQLAASRGGGYKFETVVPGHYPTRVAQHIHYLISAPGHKTLITQLYFATDPVFEGNPDKNFTKDPLLGSRELVRPVALFTDSGSIHAAVVFEICLEKA